MRNTSITFWSVLDCDKEKYTFPLLSRANIRASRWLTGFNGIDVDDLAWDHTYLVKLVSFIQDSSILITRVPSRKSGIISIAYYCRSTRQRVVFACAGTFFDIRKLSDISYFIMFLTRTFVTTMSCCYFTSSTTLSTFSIGICCSSIWLTTLLMASFFVYYSSSFFFKSLFFY